MVRRIATGVALLAAVCILGACEVASAIRAPRPRNAEPFNFRVSVGPSDFNIEGYFVSAATGGRSPALLVLLGRDTNAAKCVEQGRLLAVSGVHVACVNIPGFGRSTGPSRFVGAQAVATARRALDLLEQRPDVDAKRLAVWGVSDGAVAAGLLMDSDARPRAVILQSGAYDLLNLWPEAPLATKLAILREVWPSRRVLRERSVIENLPPRLDLDVLILHGARDTRMPVDQARRLEAALKARGARVESLYFADGRHNLGQRAEVPARRFLRDSLLDAESRASS
jgi:alpha-beta hydrolase superfamily lysophospholipase